MRFRILNLGMNTLRQDIKICQKESHVQQVAYSTYHDCLTQICFTCVAIRTSMKEKDYADTGEENESN